MSRPAKSRSAKSQTAQIGFATFSLEHLVLGLLMLEARHGYQLYQDYEALFLPIWKVGRSKFYAALSSLHDSGHLTVQTTLQGERPPRKVYYLTDVGRARFISWLYQPVTPMRAIRVEFLAKLRFIELLQPADAARIINAQIAACQETIDQLTTAQLTAQQEGPSQDDAPSDPDPVLELVHDFRRRQARFIIEWLAVCRDRFTQDETA